MGECYFKQSWRYKWYQITQHITYKPLFNNIKMQNLDL